ncbi:DUF397 domain-containing protein [Streptomyces sp. NBC_00986]|uniref:DUF397 domain-containing protein n=1 Tax=Streptomyces sp. NBC_00986 TaxID=2903702 RepID=UPI00386D47C9|nr:DUF397 domain-containing protein [Streptomyces sp. NBC_00986]
MQAYENGVAADSIRGVEWVKSSASSPDGGNCVEFAALPNGDVAVRNSRFPDGPALVYKRSEIGALLIGVRLGEFDMLAV